MEIKKGEITLRTKLENLQNYFGVTWKGNNNHTYIGMCYNGDPDIVGVQFDTTYDASQFIEDLDKWFRSEIRGNVCSYSYMRRQ